MKSEARALVDHCRHSTASTRAFGGADGDVRVDAVDGDDEMMTSDGRLVAERQRSSCSRWHRRAHDCEWCDD